MNGNDQLMVPANIVKKLNKNRQLKRAMDIKLSKTNIRKQVGGNLLTTILGLARTVAPTIAKTLGLSALAGAVSEGTSQIVKNNFRERSFRRCFSNKARIFNNISKFRTSFNTNANNGSFFNSSKW